MTQRPVHTTATETYYGCEQSRIVFHSFVKEVFVRFSGSRFCIFGMVAAALLPIPAAQAQTDTDYRYDSLGRLVEVTYDDGTRVIYHLDDVGNRQSVVKTTGGNSAPSVTGESITVSFEGSASFQALQNDSDADADTLTLSSVTTPGHGAASISSNQITYTAGTGFYGADSFSYAVSDGTTTTNGSVSVTVSPPPVVELSTTVNQSSYAFPGSEGLTDTEAIPWIEWELDSIYVIRRIEGTQVNNNDSDATVSYSTNGTSWTSAGTIASAATVDFDMGLVEAKYIRVQDSGTDQLAAGFDVYGYVVSQ